LSDRPLLPDFVIDMPDGNRALLIEVKLTATSEGSPQRDGLRDMLAYLTDAATLFCDRPMPHGLVVAWNATGYTSEPPTTAVAIVHQGRVADMMRTIGQLAHDGASSSWPAPAILEN
jgi:hypothetical protein